MLIGTRNRALLVGVGGDQARIDRKGGSVDQELCRKLGDDGVR
ncbi:hypothetical protein V1281_006472 [Nitrobacteraceae bacterium AZCC 2161]